MRFVNEYAIKYISFSGTVDKSKQYRTDKWKYFLFCSKWKSFFPRSKYRTWSDTWWHTWKHTWFRYVNASSVTAVRLPTPIFSTTFSSYNSKFTTTTGNSIFNCQFKKSDMKLFFFFFK